MPAKKSSTKKENKASSTTQPNKTRRNHSFLSNFSRVSRQSDSKFFRDRTWINTTRNQTPLTSTTSLFRLTASIRSLPLSNFYISEKLNDIGGFRGVYSKDELDNVPAGGSCVVNIQDFNDGSGTHWVAIYDNNYFDSFGLPPSNLIKKIYF